MVMKQILLIDREFGAGGSTIAAKVAARLGWNLLDQKLTQEIARLAHIPPEDCRRREERADPWLQRLVNLIWRGSFERNLPPPDMTVLNTDRLIALVRQVVEQAIAAGPCIIVGRGAPYFLRGRTDTFCVFLFASRELRYRRVLQRTGDAQRAIELVDTMDEERRKFVKHQFGHEWPDRHLFHAMLNTAVGDEATVEAILYLLNAANRSEEADGL
jgi:cytidylate kinase